MSDPANDARLHALLIRLIADATAHMRGAGKSRLEEARLVHQGYAAAFQDAAMYVVGILAAGRNQPDSQASHVYLSTGCLHGDHGYCQSRTGLSGQKTPGVCKFCKSPCTCPCHVVMADLDRPKRNPGANVRYSESAE